MNIDIYNKNCLDGLKEIQNDSFDLTITSPPYNMNRRIRNGQYCSRQVIESEFSNKYKNFSDNLPIQDFYQFHYDVLYELIRVSNLVFYNISIVTGSKRAFFKLIGDFSMELKEIIVWDKGHGQPAIEKGVLNRRSEIILVFDKYNSISRKFKDSFFPKGSQEDVWNISRQRKSNTQNQAAFPKEIPDKIISLFGMNADNILDPFMGTGTVALSCIDYGINFVGFEIEKQQFLHTQKLLQQKQLQLQLFK